MSTGGKTSGQGACARLLLLPQCPASLSVHPVRSPIVQVLQAINCRVVTLVSVNDWRYHSICRAPCEAKGITCLKSGVTYDE